MSGWTRANLRHAWSMLWRSRNPAATVYESLGPDLFLALAPGWLNVGYWDGSGEEAEAARAPGALVARVADALPAGGTVVDVANGLGAQDEVIADVARPRRLVAVNVTEMQLRAGRHRLDAARAWPVAGDAVALPVASGVADGLISIEAAFHFPSRARFYAEARRVLRPGGVLTMSDVTVERMPRTPRELLAGLVNVRFWGLRRSSAQGMAELARLLARAGFTDVRIEPCGDRTVDPMVGCSLARLGRRTDAPRLQAWAARWMLRSWRMLRARGMIEYVLIRATAA